MPSVRVVDIKVPVRGLLWSWNRLEWPPVEWLAGTHDVVHSQSPLLIPTSGAAQVVTVHDLDFLRHPDQMSAEMRRDYPALARSHAARAHAVIVSSQYAAGEVTRELLLDQRGFTSVRRGNRRGPSTCGAAARPIPPNTSCSWER